MKRIWIQLSLSFMAFVLSGTVWAQGLCQFALQTDTAVAQDFYETLKRKDPSSLNLENSDEEKLFIRHLQNVAQGRPLLIFTDASFAQTSGVVTVMKIMQQIETKFGLRVRLVMPEDFRRSIPLPKWKFLQDVTFTLPTEEEVLNILRTENPFAVHIMVEGTLGRKVRKVLLEKNIPFTTAYHTDFPKFLSSSLPIPFLKDVIEKMAYRDLNHFHSASQGMMVPTESMDEQLVANGFAGSPRRKWSHGVDLDVFSPRFRDESLYGDLPRPISLYVGRVAPEKNIEAFLAMKKPGTKVVIGSGPSLEKLKAKYPDVVFLGRKPQAELPPYYASADLFVFTSLTDTFGLVSLEAAACGTPILAFNVQGPKDAVPSSQASVLVEYPQKKLFYGPSNFQASVQNLEDGFDKALTLDRSLVRKFAETRSWDKSMLEFLYFLHPLENPLQNY